MKSTDVMIAATHHTPPATPPPGAWRLLLSESLYLSVLDNLHSKALLGSVLGSVQPSRLGVCNRVQSGAYLRAERAWERAMKWVWKRGVKCAVRCSIIYNIEYKYLPMYHSYLVNA